MSIDSQSLTGWKRVALAIEKIRERLLHSRAALEKAGIRYWGRSGSGLIS